MSAGNPFPVPLIPPHEVEHVFLPFAKAVLWPAPLLQRLLSFAFYSIEPNQLFVDQIRHLTSLLPTQHTLTVLSFVPLVPVSEKAPTLDPAVVIAFDNLSSSAKPHFDDETVLAIWPARTKMDLSIRRTRLRDTFGAYRLERRVSEFWSLARRLLRFDIISTVNILNAHLLMSTQTFDWFAFFDRLGAFANDVDHFLAVAKVVNDRGKKAVSADFPLDRVLECSVLCGFRNPPVFGFDIMEEASLLAAGGGRRGFDHNNALAEFETIAEEVLTVPAEITKPTTFEEYVASLDWVTSGASSEGKVYYEYEGVRKSFKARKNALPYVSDLAELAATALARDSQVNWTIVKSELAKIRLAVSSDLYTYLKMSWIKSYLGSAYKQWAGSTTEESFSETTDRLIAMLDAVSRSWNLPFDYSGFDHQPNTDELIALSRIFINIARRQVPPTHLSQFDAVAATILSSFHKSSLHTKDDKGRTTVLRVIGGLMSGLGWTSLLGNAWNTVMTNWCFRVLSRLSVDRPRAFWIRGDDTALCCRSYAQALMMRLTYSALGAVGNDAKMAIFYGKSEFLRVVYDSQGAHGYPARAIPMLSQRKPWSASPWSEASTMEHVYDAVRTLRRRGLDGRVLDSWWRSATRVWSQVHHVSASWLSIPRSLGGLGIEPWRGDCLPVVSWPKAPQLSLRLEVSQPGPALTVQTEFAAFIPISLDEAKSLSYARFVKTISSDDVPVVSSDLRRQTEYPTRSPVPAPKPPWNGHILKTLRSEYSRLAGLTADRGAFRRSPDPGVFGTFRWFQPFWDHLSEISRLRGNTRLLSAVRSTHPTFYRAVRSLEAAGLSRTETISWLFGDTPLGTTRSLHPMLNSVLLSSVVGVVSSLISRTSLRPPQFTQFIHLTTSYLETALLSSPAVIRLYSW